MIDGEGGFVVKVDFDGRGNGGSRLEFVRCERR